MFLKIKHVFHSIRSIDENFDTLFHQLNADLGSRHASPVSYLPHIKAVQYFKFSIVEIQLK